MAERARLQRQISSDVAHAQRALGEDCSTEEAVATIVRQQRLIKLLMMRGPRATIVRSAAQVAAQKATDAARPKGDHRSAGCAAQGRPSFGSTGCCSKSCGFCAAQGRRRQWPCAPYYNSD